MKALLTIVVVACACASAFSQADSGDGSFHAWWHDRYPGEPLNSPDAKKLPRISVQANHFVDPQGKVVLFRGLSIADPDKIEHEGHWNQDLFEHVHETGARLVRIPVHPIAWRTRGPLAYLKLLDQAVRWSTSLNMYVDIDWHSIGNLNRELFQDPMYETTPGETFNFWRTIAHHFTGNNTVAFYELYNEPTTYNDQLGPTSWDEWKGTNEKLIALIRAFDGTKIPLVAGFDWAYDLTPLHTNPIQAAGIGYVTHPYPFKRSKPWEAKWDEDFGFAAGAYPLIATEIGFSTGPHANPQTSDYGPSIVKYLESRGISWTAWVYDPEWEPSLINSWSYDLSDSGKFFSQAMQGNVP